MSNYFKDAGYATHLIGKWHLGYFQQKYTPSNRGFDNFFGYYNGFFDYYNYTYVEIGGKFSPGYDFRRNRDVNYDVKFGTYATDLFTDEAIDVINGHDERKKPLFMILSHLAPHTGNEYDPLQAPAEEVQRQKSVKDPNRRILAGNTRSKSEW